MAQQDSFLTPKLRKYLYLNNTSHAKEKQHGSKLTAIELSNQLLMNPKTESESMMMDQMFT
jgi:hypothetical protein